MLEITAQLPGPYAYILHRPGRPDETGVLGSDDLWTAGQLEELYPGIHVYGLDRNEVAYVLGGKSCRGESDEWVWYAVDDLYAKCGYSPLEMISQTEWEDWKTWRLEVMPLGP